jgi:hypothetical protein
MMTQIRTSIHAGTHQKDWSKVRSPSRAERRLREGKRKHGIPTKFVPGSFEINGVIYAHPVVIEQLRAVMP